MVGMKEKIAVMAFIFFSMLMLYCGGEHENSAPPVGGYNVYMGHIHNHTSFSAGGTGTPGDAYAYARDIAHMDFLGVTEHDFDLAGTEWADVAAAADGYNSDGEFVALRGFEWSSSSMYGHVAVLDTVDYCSSNDPATDTFVELCSWLGTSNGIAFFNHPGREDSSSTEFGHFTTSPVENFVGMELWNKSDGFNVYLYNDGYVTGDGGMGYYDEALQNGWHTGAAGSGDDHKGTWGTAQPYRLAVLAQAKTRTGILAALRARSFYSTLDRNLSMSFKINGQEMGARISAGSYMAEIETDDGSEGDVFTVIELLKNGVTAGTWSPGERHVVITQALSVSAGEYYYIRVKQADGGEAVSSPIWIE